jgi:plastocyanin
VKKGTTVTWTNNDQAPHTVTRDGPNGPESTTLSQGQSYSFTFDQKSIFHYHCAIHPDMKGTVYVTD